MVLAFILYTYVALELCMLLKDVNDGSRILIKVKVTFIKPDVWVFKELMKETEWLHFHKDATHVKMRQNQTRYEHNSGWWGGIVRRCVGQMVGPVYADAQLQFWLSEGLGEDSWGDFIHPEWKKMYFAWRSKVDVNDTNAKAASWQGMEIFDLQKRKLVWVALSYQ